MILYRKILKNLHKLSFILFMLMSAFCLLKVLTPLLLSFLKGKVHHSLVKSFPFIDFTETIDVPEIIRIWDENDSASMLSKTRNFIFAILSIKRTAQYDKIQT